jgi:hypothetical protein
VGIGDFLHQRRADDGGIGETRDLGRLLSALADATRAQARMRHGVDAGRAQVRSATRLVLAVTALFTVTLFVFSRAYLAPYATPEGQLWLALVGIVFFAALVLLARLDRIELPAQPLVAVEPDPADGGDPADRGAGGRAVRR